MIRMGISYVSQAYTNVVEKKVDVYMRRFLGELKNPQFREQAQQGLCGLIERESEGLIIDIVSGNGVGERLDLMRKAESITAQLEELDIGSPRKFFRLIAENTVTNPEIIDELKRMGVWPDDK